MSNRDDALSQTELDEIRQRCESASPGPWRSFIEGRDHTSGSSFIMTGPETDRGEDIELSGATAADHDFISNARQDVPRLIQEIVKLRDVCERLQQERDQLRRDMETNLDEQRPIQKHLGKVASDSLAIKATRKR